MEIETIPYPPEDPGAVLGLGIAKTLNGVVYHLTLCTSELRYFLANISCLWETVFLASIL